MRVNPVLPHDYSFSETPTSPKPEPNSGQTEPSSVSVKAGEGAVPCGAWCIDFYEERLHTIDCDVANRRDPILRSCDYCGHVAGRTRAALDEHVRRTHMPPSAAAGE